MSNTSQYKGGNIVAGVIDDDDDSCHYVIRRVCELGKLGDGWYGGGLGEKLPAGFLCRVQDIWEQVSAGLRDPFYIYPIPEPSGVSVEVGRDIEVEHLVGDDMVRLFYYGEESPGGDLVEYHFDAADPNLSDKIQSVISMVRGPFPRFSYDSML